MYLKVSDGVKYVHWEIELKGIIDIIFHHISASHWSCHIFLSITPADDDNARLELEKHPNQIKSRNRCCSEAEHVFKDLYQRILWLYSFCMYLGQPSPCHSHRPHTWLWKWINFSRLLHSQKLLIFRLFLFVPFPQFVLPCLLSFPILLLAPSLSVFPVYLMLCTIFIYSIVCHLWVTLLSKCCKKEVRCGQPLP